MLTAIGDDGDSGALHGDRSARAGDAHAGSARPAKGSAGSVVPLPQSGIAVIRLSSIGDIVLTEPVVAALRSAYPDADIAFVVKSRYRELVEAHPGITRVNELHGSSVAGFARLCSELRSRRYSTVVDLHHNQRSILLGVCARSSIVTTYRKREFGDAARVRIGRQPFRASKRLVTRYLESLKPLGVGAVRDRPRLFVSDAAAAGARKRLDGWGLDEQGFAAVAPAALWSTKRWPADRFARVASGLAKDRGLDILLVGSGADRALCEDLLSGIDAGSRRVVNAAGSSGLGEFAGILGSARVFVGNDSGPMHMAMARGTPTVAVFGPTDPGQFDFSDDAVVYADLECSACSFYGTKKCRLGHWDCMEKIAAEPVLAAAFELLDRRPPRDGGGE